MKVIGILTLAFLSFSLCSAQSTKARWGAFTMGYHRSVSENTAVHSVAGQAIVGLARGPRTVIISGFLADTLFRKVLVAVGRREEGVPGAYALAQNYPNPFNPTTVVRSQTPEVSDVRIVIYDVLGREVKVLVDERRAAGSYEDSFDASGLASGVYVYRMEAGKFVRSRKMLLIK